MTLDWYYGNIKTKFRRHGGAKVLREFYKKKKGQKSRRCFCIEFAIGIVLVDEAGIYSGMVVSITLSLSPSGLSL